MFTAGEGKDRDVSYGSERGPILIPMTEDVTAVAVKMIVVLPVIIAEEDLITAEYKN